MKKIFVTAFAVLLGAFSAGAQEVVDTLDSGCNDCGKETRNVGPGIFEKDSVGNHRLLDFDIPFYSKVRKNRSTSYDVNRANLGFGLLKAYSSEPYEFNVQNSYELFFCFDAAQIHLTGRSVFAVGLGFDWKNFVMTGDAMVKNETGQVSIGQYPENSAPKSSKLRLASIIMPVTYSCSLGRRLGFTLGPVLNFNTHSSIVNKYSLDGSKQKDKYKKVHCNAFTVDLMFQLNLDDIGLFVKYCPVPVMDKSYWPGWQYGSAGIAVSFL